MKHWDIDEENTKDHWIELLGAEEYGSRWWWGHATWDGCLQINRVFNVPLPIDEDDSRQLVDGIHICDIDDFIEKLVELKKIATKHFDNEYWTLDN